MKPAVLRNATGNLVTVTALTADSKNIYSSDSDGGLTIWEKPGLDSKYIPGQTSTQIISLFSDGTHIYSGSISGDSEVRVYNQELDLLNVLKGHVGTVFDITADSEYLFTGSGDSTIRIWNKENWACVKSFVGQTHFVLSIAVDEKFIYGGGIDNCTNVFSRDNYKRVTSLYGHDASIFSIATDEKYVYSGSGELWWGGPGSPRPRVFESAVRVWDKKDWNCVHVLKGHTDNVNALGVDKLYVYSASDDGTVRVYSKSDWTEVNKIDSGVGRIIDLTHDYDYIFYGCADGNIRYVLKSDLTD